MRYRCQRCRKWWTEKYLKEKDCWGKFGTSCPECGGVVVVRCGAIITDGKMGSLQRGWKRNEEISIQDFKNRRVIK